MKLVGFYIKHSQVPSEDVTVKRRKRRNWRPLLVLVLLLALLGILVWAAWSALHWWNSRVTEPVELDFVGEIPIHEEYIPLGSRSRPGEKRRVEWIVIHETDNFNPGADAAAHSAFLMGLDENDDPRSWHYTVDDHQIYHHLPDDEAAYHASDKLNEHGGNLNGIGIEMCVNEGGNYEKTLENTIQLTAKLMLEYRLKKADIQTHQYFSPTDKVCPARLLEQDRWEEFLERAEAARKELIRAEREAKHREQAKQDSALPAFLYNLLHNDDES